MFITVQDNISCFFRVTMFIQMKEKYINVENIQSQWEKKKVWHLSVAQLSFRNVVSTKTENH